MDVLNLQLHYKILLSNLYFYNKNLFNPFINKFIDFLTLEYVKESHSLTRAVFAKK